MGRSDYFHGMIDVVHDPPDRGRGIDGQLVHYPPVIVPVLDIVQIGAVEFLPVLPFLAEFQEFLVLGKIGVDEFGIEIDLNHSVGGAQVPQHGVGHIPGMAAQGPAGGM